MLLPYQVKMSAVLVTFVFAEYVIRRKRAATFTWTIFITVTAVVITNVVLTTVSGVAESAYGTGYQFVPSGEPSSAYVHVGVAPIVVVILTIVALR
jgi:hypothetical protein